MIIEKNHEMPDFVKGVDMTKKVVIMTNKVIMGDILQILTHTLTSTLDLQKHLLILIMM